MSVSRKYTSSAERQAAYRARCQEAQRQQLQAKGLPALPVLATVPGSARWRAALQSAQTLLGQVSSEMADYYEARSETWQESERGDAFRERQEALEALLSELETLTL